MPYYTDQDLQPEPWINPDEVHDDLLVEFIRERCVESFNNQDGHPVRRSCVPVASAGNFGTSFPFAPAILNGVLSTEADYSRIDEVNCNLLVSDESGNVMPALTNEGAYVRDGVMWLDSSADLPSFANKDDFNVDRLINCLYGTSFATPQLAFEAATLPYSGDAILPLSNDLLLNYDLDGDGVVGDLCPEMGVQVDHEGCP